LSTSNNENAFFKNLPGYMIEAFPVHDRIILGKGTTPLHSYKYQGYSTNLET